MTTSPSRSAFYQLSNFTERQPLFPGETLGLSLIGPTWDCMFTPESNSCGRLGVASVLEGPHGQRAKDRDDPRKLGILSSEERECLLNRHKQYTFPLIFQTSVAAAPGERQEKGNEQFCITHCVAFISLFFQHKCLGSCYYRA